MGFMDFNTLSVCWLVLLMLGLATVAATGGSVGNRLVSSCFRKISM